MVCLKKDKGNEEERTKRKKKSMKRCLVSPVGKKIQLKVTMRFHSTSIWQKLLLTVTKIGEDMVEAEIDINHIEEQFGKI